MFKNFKKYWALILVLCMILNVSTASQIFAAEKDNQLNSNTGVREDVYKDIVAKDKLDNLQIDTLNKSTIVSPSIKTDLSDMTTKADKITFDLWAKDPDGAKIQIPDISVTNNGKPVAINWDDQEKTSYTLELEVGRNNVKIDVKYNEENYIQEYTIICEEAEDGEVIGSFTFTMEAFTVGLGYLIEPIQVDIHKGRNSAQELDQIIRDNGYDYSNTGTLESSFYLQYVSNDTNKIYKTTPKISDILKAKLDSKYDEEDYRNGKLGEFDFNSMSGWMYAVNNVFPNVGFADKYLQDGDVMRVQFTLAYGNDIGGSDAIGGGSRNEFFPKVNKDKLTKKVAEINSSQNREKYLSNQSIKSAYDTGIEILKKVDASQEEIDRAYGQLANARVEFKDLSNHKWAVEAVNSMAAKGIIGGKTEDTFDPAANITRAEFSALVSRMLKYNEDIDNELPFKDVSKDKWYHKSISAVYKNELINGKSNTSFDPEGYITREEISKIIGQILENKLYEKQDIKYLSKFNDSDKISPWAREGAAISSYNKIISGYNGQFLPKQNATRAETAVMLYRLYDLIMD